MLKLFSKERIFEEGKDALHHEFGSLLNRHGRPVPAILILDLLNTDEGTLLAFTGIYYIQIFSVFNNDDTDLITIK